MPFKHGFTAEFTEKTQSLSRSFSMNQITSFFKPATPYNPAFNTESWKNIFIFFYFFIPKKRPVGQPRKQLNDQPAAKEPRTQAEAGVNSAGDNKQPAVRHRYMIEHKQRVVEYSKQYGV